MSFLFMKGVLGGIVTWPHLIERLVSDGFSKGFGCTLPPKVFLIISVESVFQEIETHFFLSNASSEEIVTKSSKPLATVKVFNRVHISPVPFQYL